MLAKYVTSCQVQGATPNSEITKLMEEDETAFFGHRLSLGVNYLGDRGIRSFLPIISANDHLMYLNLSSQGIHNPGALAICESFLGHPSLANLDLSKNRIGTKGGHALVHLAETNEALLTLAVENNDFRISVKVEIEKALVYKKRVPSRLTSFQTVPQFTEAQIEEESFDDTESIAPPAFTPVDSYYSLPASRRVSSAADAYILSHQVLHGRNP